MVLATRFLETWGERGYTSIEHERTHLAKLIDGPSEGKAITLNVK